MKYRLKIIQIFMLIYILLSNQGLNIHSSANFKINDTSNREYKVYSISKYMDYSKMHITKVKVGNIQYTSIDKTNKFINYITFNNEFAYSNNVKFHNTLLTDSIPIINISSYNAEVYCEYKITNSSEIPINNLYMSTLLEGNIRNSNVTTKLENREMTNILNSKSIYC